MQGRAPGGAAHQPRRLSSCLTPCFVASPPLPSPPATEASPELLTTFYPTLSAIMLDALVRAAEAEEDPAAAAAEPGAQTCCADAELAPRGAAPGRQPATAAPTGDCWLPPRPPAASRPDPHLACLHPPPPSPALPLFKKNPKQTDYEDQYVQQLANLLPKDELMRRITQVCPLREHGPHVCAMGGWCVRGTGGGAGRCRTNTPHPQPSPTMHMHTPHSSPPPNRLTCWSGWRSGT